MTEKDDFYNCALKVQIADRIKELCKINGIIYLQHKRLLYAEIIFFNSYRWRIHYNDDRDTYHMRFANQDWSYNYTDILSEDDFKINQVDDFFNKYMLEKLVN